MYLGQMAKCLSHLQIIWPIKVHQKRADCFLCVTEIANLEWLVANCNFYSELIYILEMVRWDLDKITKLT